MEKVKKFFIDNIHWLVIGGVTLLCAIFLLVGKPDDNGYISLTNGQVTIDESTKEFINNSRQAMITYAEQAIPTIIINEKGEEQTIEAPTIDFIDGSEIPNQTTEDGQGAVHDTSSYMAYYNSVGVGTCINNAFGAQCFAIANDFWANYTGGRALSSCGTGAAKGTLNCWEYNAGDNFEMVWDPTKIQPGDWVVTTGGTWGHIFMAMGYYNNGYVAGFSQNQGGGYCPLGGAATNVANIKLDNFGGAFRPKTYVQPDPEPTPTPSPEPSNDCKTWNVVKGDTMGAIMKTCTGSVNWATINAYADKWISQKVNPGKSVYWGWTHGTGYGLFSGDIIKYSE